MIAIILGLLFGLGMFLAVSAWTSPRSTAPTGEIWAKLSAHIRAANVPGLTPGRFLILSAAAAVTTSVLLFALTGAVAVALILGIGAAIMPWMWMSARVSARSRKIRALWPEIIDSLISGVRSGVALPRILIDLAEEGPQEMRDAFASFARSYAANGHFDSALDQLKDDMVDPVADRIIEALRIARTVGGNDLTRLLSDLAILLREDARIRGELEARQSWTVGAARLGVAAPWIVLILLSVGRTSASVWNTPTGVSVLGIGAGMCILAYALMRYCARLSQPPRHLGGHHEPLD